jgi:hypothetical protein
MGVSAERDMFWKTLSVSYSRRIRAIAPWKSTTVPLYAHPCADHEGAEERKIREMTAVKVKKQRDSEREREKEIDREVAV